ncbi:dynein heavy chain domain-containing protein 1 [Stigmatopora argus]
MQSLRQSTSCGKSKAKPKKEQPIAVSSGQATLPPLWPKPFSHSSSSLRRSLFNPSSVVAVTSSSVTLGTQAEPVRVLTESKWTEKHPCKGHKNVSAKSSIAKHEARVFIRELFSLPVIIPETPDSTLQELSLDPNATCADITDMIVDEAPHSLLEKGASRILRRDLYNFPAIVPNLTPGTPRLASLQKTTAEIGRREWTEKPRRKAFALSADVGASVTDELAVKSLTDESITTRKVIRPNQVEKVPITGMEIVQFFLKNNDVGELQVFYLKEQHEQEYRPYDLRVVPASEAGSEHYVFTSATVLHVTQKGYGDLVSLGNWFRESVLWRALRDIPFFGKFILRNATILWYRNTREIVYQRRFDQVQEHLLANIPQYRNGLLLLSKGIKELKGTRLLPLDVSKTYTLLEFQNTLATSMQTTLNSLRQFSRFRTRILNKAKEEGYTVHKELQEHLSYAELPHHCCKPMHLHQAHLDELQGDVARAKITLQKLGNFATLVNYIIMQNLVTVVQKSVTFFLYDFLKRESSLGQCLFQTDLSFGAGHLCLDPPFRLFQETFTQAILTAGDSISQMCEICGYFLEVSSTLDCQGEISNLSCGPLTLVVDSRGDFKDNDGIPRLANYSCCRWIREQRPSWKLMMTTQGHTIPISSYPLSKEQLLWYITINDVTIGINKEQTELMQATESEIQQFLVEYAWVLDIQVYISQWSPACLENLQGEPALLYEELIKKLRQWIERIRAAPSSMSTSNQLFIIHCTNLKEYLEQQLNLIENEVQDELVKQMKILSESFLHDLDESLTTLMTEPKDMHDLPKYVDVVWNSVNILSRMQERLDYIHTLQDSICIYFREMTIQELCLRKQMLDMWDCFYSHLREAASSLHSRLPTAAIALYTMLPWMSCDLRSLLENAISGPFLDPKQNAEQLASKLKYMHLRVETASSNLEQLSKIGQILPENPVDLTNLDDLPKLTARKELWDLIAQYRRCFNEWNSSLFIELPLSEAQEQIKLWQQKVANLSSIIPAHDAVLQEISESINDVNFRVQLLSRFQTRIIKPKHRSAFFRGIGLWYSSDKNATLAQIIFHPFDLHQELINKVCEDAQKENSMERHFQIIQQAWKNRIFQLDVYTFPDASWDAKIITGLEFIFSDIEKDLKTMIYMHRSRHSVDFRMQVEEWIHLLQELGSLLHFFEIYQQNWIFLTNLFQEDTLGVQRWDLLAHFRTIDERFKTMMHCNSTHSNVLNLARPNDGDGSVNGANLFQILLNDISTMNSIFNQMANRLHSFGKSFPRLYFLSNREVVELLSLQPTPSSLLPFVRRFFKGVKWLQVEEMPGAVHLQETSETQKRVLGIFGNLKEQLTFLSPVEQNPNPLIWLSLFQEQLNSTIKHLTSRCADERKQLEPSNQEFVRNPACGDVLNMISKYPLQCLLVAEETMFYSVLQESFQESSTVKISSLEALINDQLKMLCQSLGVAVSRSKREEQLSRYTATCLRTLALLRIKHAQQITQLSQVQCQPMSSFEWLSSLKYCMTPESQSLEETDRPECYVDILGHRLPYGYEYFGPEDWGMVDTPCTDRVKMGIVLALTSYRAGILNGPCSSGKTNTVVHLGKALGRHVVMLNCSSTMTADIFQKMLLGALLTGSWFVLDSVDLLSQRVQASLAQQLEEIYQFFSGLSRKRADQGPTPSGCGSTFEPGKFLLFSGIKMTPHLNYGCVLISSNRRASKISQSLRFSTRPVALIRPDEKIIVEIMLTFFGFKKANSLSHRLVSLMSLSKDSLGLPVFVTQKDDCHLVILQNILSTSKKLLKQMTRDERFSGKARQSFVIRAILKPPENENVEDLNERQEQAIFPELLEEIAVVKAIHAVLFPFIYVSKDISLFNSIFKEMFPIAGQLPFIQQYTQDEDNSTLKEAVSEELDQLLLHSNTETICQALKLYETLVFSHVVILLGPPGSGKTTCYNALAGGLSRLANTTEETFQVDNTQIFASNWSSVNTVVLFPNAMTHEELFGGFCDKIGWKDGAVSKALRDSERANLARRETENSRHKTKAVKWLVMDGEPLGRPTWLDHLSTLSDLEKPFLCMPSGETLVSSKSRFKLLVETTDLSEASPSVVTRCSLIYFDGVDVWNAVWKSEMDSLQLEFIDQQEMLEMWTQLSEDLFSRTLGLLEKNGIANKGQSAMYGLTEITSFVRILRALLQHFARQLKNKEATGQTDTKEILGSDSNIRKDLFLLAYIWGFGGHLHPRLWPQFDMVARQVLTDSRAQIVVPQEGTVFEFFFDIDNKIYSESTLLTKSITPKYWKYTCLLKVMLGAIQPVLLAGEPGSGKSTVCNALLCFDKPHIKVPASSIRGPADLRHLLCGISCNLSSPKNKDVMKKPQGLLLFVDDLHETPCDVTGKSSKILETLRQSISKGRILGIDSDHFKVLRSGTITYLATCCVFELDNPRVSIVSPRLLRLFSVFALPNLTAELIFSMYSPQLKLWLRDIPFIPEVTDTVRNITNATRDLYEHVCHNFQPTRQIPCFLFSHHDLKKVFQGMCLWHPILPKKWMAEPKSKSKSSLIPPKHLVIELKIVHLWIHECLRAFGDRMSSFAETAKLQSLITATAKAHFSLKLTSESNIDNIIENLSLTRTRESKSSAHKSRPSSSTEANFLKQQEKFLQHLQEVVTKLTFGPEIAGNDFPRFKNSSYQPQDINVLVQHLLTHNDAKDNEQQDVDSHLGFKYTVHRQRMAQLLRIFRTLLIPGGHGLLMSSAPGTGRKTNVRMAAYLSGFHLIEVHAGNESQLHTILKKAGNQTRVYKVNTIILVHENISSSVREDLLAALMSYPGLYTDQEVTKLVSRASAFDKTRRFLLDSWIFDKYLCQNLRDVHVFVLMPTVASTKIGNDECKAQITKALGLCCVETYQPWFDRSLVEVAAYHLKNTYQNLKIQDSPVGLAAAMAGVHRTAIHYASVFLTTQPFSPHTFMVFISHFGYICKLMLNELESRANRLNACLSHLDALDNLAMEDKNELITTQTIVAEKKTRVDTFNGAIHEQKRLLEKAEKKLARQKLKIQIIGDRLAESEDELKPYFQEAHDVIHILDPLDLAEVGHYRDPPDGVVLVMDAVLLLFDRPFGWENAKQLFLQCNLYKCLENFDFYSLPDKNLLGLAEIIKNPILAPELIREVSKACETLCRWLLSIHKCGTVCYHLVIKTQLDLMLKRMKAELEAIKKYIRDIHRRLEELDAEVKPVQEFLEVQVVLLQEDESHERKAANAADMLLKHARNWRADAQEAQLQRQCLLADSMVLAGIITYLGPFADTVRDELLSKWRLLCHTGHIDINLKDHRSSLLAFPESPRPTSGFPMAVSDALQPLLGRVLDVKDWPSGEPATARLVAKLLMWGCTRSWVKNWPLLADTQHHLEINLNNGIITGEMGDDNTLGKEFECDLVVCADDPKLMSQLELATEKGFKILITHVERAPVTPQFLATLARPIASCHLGSKQTSHQSHPEFFLLLSTHCPARLLNNAIHPSVLAQVDVVDLSPSSAQIQEILLTQLLQSECKVLLIQHLRMENDKLVMHRKLVAEEDTVLDLVLQSDIEQIQAPEFLAKVTEIQDSMAFTQTQLRLVDETQQYNGPLLAAPEQLTKLARFFYQALQELSRLSQTYHFPLSHFMAIMQEVFADKAGKLVSYGTGVIMGGVIPEIRNMMVSKLMFYYRPLLFRGHYEVLRQLVTLAVMQTNQLCSPPERTAFLMGLKDILAPNQVDSDHCLDLDLISAFRGIQQSLSSSRKEWQEYLSLPTSVTAGPVPSESHSHLSLIQRALLSKTLRPHSSQRLAEAMAACQFRQASHSSVPHCGNPGALYPFLQEHEGPIVLTWPRPSEEKWISIQPLHVIKLLAFKAAKPVNVISVGGLSDMDSIMVALEKAVKEGHWLVFNNCHLLEDWDGKLVARFNQLFSPFGAKTHLNTPHSDFRLWLLTEETTRSFFPAIVRMHALPLVCDSSWNMKEELSCSLQYLSFLAKSHPENLADNTELLLRCATFHSVLLQREAYKAEGQSRMSSWSQSDLLALVDAVISSAHLCHDKTKALQYIAVNLVHGSHMTDWTDCEVVQNAAESCFCAEPPEATGPHVLANVISRTEHRDIAKLPRLLAQQLIRSVDVSEPLLLGFGSDVEAEIVQMNSHNFNKMLRASQIPPRRALRSASASATMPELGQARERLLSLQQYLMHQNESRSRNAGPVFQSPLYDFLLTEWQELNDSVSSLLGLLRQPLQYLADTFRSLPALNALWRMQRRAELLSAYLWRDNDSATRATYRLSAFANAKGLLVALMRKAAQAHHTCLGEISLHLGVTLQLRSDRPRFVARTTPIDKTPFSVHIDLYVTKSGSPPTPNNLKISNTQDFNLSSFQVRDDPLFTPLPKEAVYLCDLNLKGASWNAERAALESTLSPQPSAMPLICIRAHVKDAQSPRFRIPDQVYHCPIYLEDLNTGEENINDLSLITTVPLASDLEPSLCSLRKVRLVSRLFAPSEQSVV